MKNKRLIIVSSSAIFLLLIPLIAMQFSDQVNWSFMDFVIMGVLLLGVSFLIEIVFRKIKGYNYRIYLILGIVLIFLLIWAELGVGILGTPFAGN